MHNPNKIFRVSDMVNAYEDRFRELDASVNGLTQRQQAVESKIAERETQLGQVEKNIAGALVEYEKIVGLSKRVIRSYEEKLDQTTGLHNALVKAAGDADKRSKEILSKFKDGTVKELLYLIERQDVRVDFAVASFFVFASKYHPDYLKFIRKHYRDMLTEQGRMRMDDNEHTALTEKMYGNAIKDISQSIIAMLDSLEEGKSTIDQLE